MIQVYEPLRPIYAEFDTYSPFWWRTVFGFHRVHYGASEWPSMSYWIVPGTLAVDETKGEIKW